MQITNFQRLHSKVSTKGFEQLATFTLILEHGVKLFGVKFILAPSGEHLVYPPDLASGSSAWTMTREMRDEVVKLALAEMKNAALMRFAKIASL